MQDLIAPDIKAAPGYTPYTDPARVLEMRYPPEPMPGTERKPYAVSLKEDCPYWTVVVLGISFHKYTHTPVTRLGDSPEPTLPVFHFAENELEAIQLKAEDKTLTWRERTDKGIKVHSDPASKYIEIRPLPPDREYGHVVKVSDLVTMLLPPTTEATLEEKRRQFERLQAEIKQLEENAKKSEKAHKKEGR